MTLLAANAGIGRSHPREKIMPIVVDMTGDEAEIKNAIAAAIQSPPPMFAGAKAYSPSTATYYPHYV